MRSSLLLLYGAVSLAGARLGAQVTMPGVRSPSVQSPGVTSSAPGTQPAVGRRGGRHGQRGGGRRALLRGISLTDAQRSQLTGIERRYRDEHRTLRGSGTGAGAGRGAVRADTASRAAARSLRQRELADLRGVLTPDQQTVFDRNLQQWQANARQRHAARTTRPTTR